MLKITEHKRSVVFSKQVIDSQIVLNMRVRKICRFTCFEIACQLVECFKVVVIERFLLNGLSKNIVLWSKGFIKELSRIFIYCIGAFSFIFFKMNNESF